MLLDLGIFVKILVIYSGGTMAPNNNNGKLISV